jgi:hypothetical protein
MGKWNRGRYRIRRRPSREAVAAGKAEAEQRNREAWHDPQFWGGHNGSSRTDERSIEGGRMLIGEFTHRLYDGSTPGDNE